MKLNILDKDKFDTRKFIGQIDNIVIARGGDGTLLKAITKFYSPENIFYGEASGTMNFLMNVIPYSRTQKIKVKKFKRIKVKVTILEPNIIGDLVPVIKEFQVLNDVFISEENGWIDFNCHDKDMILGKFKGSGLIISTAIGTTGISKNNNGVILPLSSNDWVVTGDKTNRTINYVLKNNRMSIKVNSRGTVNIFGDGHNHHFTRVQSVEILKGDSVKIGFADYKKMKRKRRI
jgi:NAD kinase